MNDKITARIATLEGEYATGQKMLADIDTKRQTIVSMLLRIEGAMQVLRELAADVEPPTTAPDHPTVPPVPAEPAPPVSTS